MNKTLQVLVVEDNPADVDLIREILLDTRPVRFELESVPRLSDALAHLRGRNVDLVLLDLGLPDSQGLSTFFRIKDAAPTLPMVLLTGNNEQEVAVAAVKAGAQDYLVKGEVGKNVLARAMLYAVERKRAENKLARSEEEWQRTFDSMNSAVWILDADQRVLRSNKNAERLFHRPNQELVGKHCWEIVHGTAQPIPECPTSRARTSLRSESVELQLGEAAVEVAVHPILDATGRFDGAVHIVSDITERRRMQATLAQSDRLASMGMLAAGVAHEINNPLAYVLYNVDSLAQDLPKLAGAAKRCCSALRDQVGEASFLKIAGDGAEMLQSTMLEDAVDRAREAFAGAQRIREIARGLGTFSRVERVEHSMVDLKFAIECAINMAFNEIKYRARLVKDFGQAPAIWASEGKLSQVFLNLLINAAHAIDEGNVENNQIKIRTWSEGDEVFAEVTDTGKGIPAENLERIFEPFFTTKKAGVGSGLGLAICRNIVGEFGGDIRVASQVGKGTSFVIRLPAKTAAPEERPDQVVSEKPRASTVRGRILVVDDEEEIRKTLTRLLGREHEVLTAASGEAGQALLEHDRSFDLILCDLMMPKMSGMDLHAWLAARDAAYARQIVFVSGGAFTPKAAEYLASVGNLRIEKPFDAVNFKKLVSELIVAARSKSGKPATVG